MFIHATYKKPATTESAGGRGCGRGSRHHACASSPTQGRQRRSDKLQTAAALLLRLYGHVCVRRRARAPPAASAASPAAGARSSLMASSCVQ